MKTLYHIVLFIMLLTPASSIFGQTIDARAEGVALYNQGRFKEAGAALEKAVKAAPNDAAARTYLGLAQVRLGNMKDAAKTLEKSLELDPDQPNARKALAYALVLRGRFKDSIRHLEILRTARPLDDESFYVLGWAELQLRNFDAALENAEQSIRLSPDKPNAYFLKAQALMNRPNSPEDYAALAAKYGSALDNIGKFVMLSANAPDAGFWRGQQATLKYFADYYAEREKEKTAGRTQAGQTTSELKITAKPRADYSARARGAGVGGTVRLLAAFGETGRVEQVLVITSLGYGLDEEAIKAAKAIKFTPRQVAGKPVATVRPIEYTFTIY